MSIILSLSLASMFLLASVAEVEVPFFKKTDCGDLCASVRCATPATPAACDNKTQVFVARDGDCYCCDECVQRTAPLERVIGKKCADELCKHTACQDVTATQCFDQGMAFAPKDSDCACCDTCEPI